jgi:ketosteroid isomerase-like protein
MTLRLSLALLAAAAFAGAAQAAPLPTDQVVAAERAFAADGKAMGWVEAFKKNAAPDAILFRQGVVNAQANLAKAAPVKPDAGVLAWWPLWAGAGRSGDLGFTTGAATYGGKPISHYFTIWKKQADGVWKWEFDGGEDALQPSPFDRDSEAIPLPAATASTGSAGKAMAQVKAAEAELAAGAKADMAGTYRRMLSPHARTIGWTAPLAEGPAAYLATLGARASTIDFRMLGGEASQAGDLAWVYGEAGWSADGKPRTGHYVRVWQDSREGWRLVFDQLYPDPAPAA